MLHPTILLTDLRTKFFKTQERLEKSIRNGSFNNWSSNKKNTVLRRLQRYAKKLNIQLKPALVAALIVAGCFFSDAAKAQTYSLVPGASSPFNGKSVSSYSKPAFADIDNDGDFDLYSGQTGFYTQAKYFLNTGTASAAVFGSSSSIGNMLFDASVALVDLDNDGDKDLIIADDDFMTPFHYFKNNGTPSSPNFVEITDGTNPFYAISDIPRPAIALVDLDNDGDQDLAIGKSDGSILYYKNTGTAASAVFTQQSGASNPFNGISAGTNAAPAFCDIDKDGDQDLVVGKGDGTLLYYKNTGSAASPTFTQQTGVSNPFNGIDVGDAAAPTFVDLDNNTTKDLVIGNTAGAFIYYTNTTTTLPVQWLGFNVQRSGSKALIDWTVGAELNTLDFIIQRSTDGTNWTNIGSVKAAGNSALTKTYQFIDENPVEGLNQYRLLQRDVDGHSSFSEIKSIRMGAKTAGFSLVNTTVSNGLLPVNVTGDKTLLLLNAQGQLLQKFQVINGLNYLEVARYASGVYFLGSNGKAERFIIQ